MISNNFADATHESRNQQMINNMNEEFILRKKRNAQLGEDASLSLISSLAYAIENIKAFYAGCSKLEEEKILC